MLIIISPAKTLDYDSELLNGSYSTPDFLNQSEQLLEKLRTFSPDDISQLMSLSPKLAALNAKRYLNWHQPFTPDNARPAIYAFKGDVYEGFDVKSHSVDDINWAQQHLRILSGLYGLLRPLDLMQPYRLEMGTKLSNQKGDNLYDFWKSTITDALNQQLATSQSEYLINLASNEYSNAVNMDEINSLVITPIFKDWKNGKYKIISFFAKKARGMMSAWIIKNRITKAEQLHDFNIGKYHYCSESSTLSQPVFLSKKA